MKGKKNKEFMFASILCKEAANEFIKSVCTLAKIKEKHGVEDNSYSIAFKNAKSKLKTLADNYRREVHRELDMNATDIQALVDAMDMVVLAA